MLKIMEERMDQSYIEHDVAGSTQILRIPAVFIFLRSRYLETKQREFRLPILFDIIFGAGKDWEATDPRDYIFGISGLSGETVSGLVNYKHSPSEVFCNATEFLFRTGGIDMLSYVQRWRRDLGPNIPSWVVNWIGNGDEMISQSIAMGKSPLFKASGTTKLGGTDLVISDKKLSFPMVTFDIVHGLSSPRIDSDSDLYLRDPESFKTLSKWVNGVRRLALKQNFSVPHPDIEDMVARLLIIDRAGDEGLNATRTQANNQLDWLWSLGRLRRST